MILLAFGTRPEFLKIKPLIKEFNKGGIKYKLLFTGQHEDLLKEIQVDQALNIQEGNNRLDAIISSIINNIDFHGIDYVLVQGDTSSVIAVALSAFHHKIPVIHLEAGLRTFDKENPYPEEVNRLLVSQIADYHLCPTKLSYDNLSTVSGKVVIVGNTALDNLLDLKYTVKYGDHVLITMHRRENHDKMDVWFKEINKIAENHNNLQFIFPLHPNPNVQKHKDLLTANNITKMIPIPHDDLLRILTKARLVITDSGGIQEEASFFNKICLTCRKVTERPEALGESTILIKNPLELSEIFDKFVNNYIIDYKSPFGDGHAAEKIVKQFKLWNIK